MPDTKEFISRLMDKNDDDLENLLSFADERRIEGKHDNKNADSILEEILNSHNKTSGKKSLFKKISAAPSLSPEAKNLHHIMPEFSMPEYISYGSICDFAAEKTTPVIEDDSAEESLPTDNDKNENQAQESSETDEANDEPTPETLNLPDGKLPLYDEEHTSDVERFIANQESKHPVLYFAVGFSIVLVTVLGLASCVYLGVTALRSSGSEDIGDPAVAAVSAADIQ
ncbi:MAG: hypothetical protein E7505_06755 [Ruminococcus sp.]|nr:hypothetical protein [Ruminococcus sp.]